MSASWARPEQVRPIAAIRAWIGLACFVAAPIDVIDVLGFAGDFRLTPFLLLSVLYVSSIIVEALIASPALSLKCFDATELAAMCFICLMACSFLFSIYDPLRVAPARLVYTSWLVIFAVVFVNAERESLPLTIVRSTRVFILLDMVAIATQFGAAIAGVELPKYLEGLSIKTLDAFSRPAGLIYDPNAAAVMLALLLGFSYLAGHGLPKEKRLGVPYYIAGLTLATVTISRTGTVALGLLLLIMFQGSAHKKKLFLRICLVAFILLCAGAAYLTSTRSADQLTEAASHAFLQRDESNYEHFGVMKEGTLLFFGDAKVFLIGTGWGTEYHYTEAFFPGNKYGNFHCTYISIAVQGGVMALFCLLFLFFKPLMLRHDFGRLAVIFLWSSIFYQYHGYPLWWILLFALNKGRIRGIRVAMSRYSAAKATRETITGQPTP
jgi:hypothetical protein